jgi:hypothetical protein
MVKGVKQLFEQHESNIKILEPGQQLAGYQFDAVAILLEPYLMNTTKGLDWVGDLRERMAPDSIMLHMWDDMILKGR